MRTTRRNVLRVMTAGTASLAASAVAVRGFADPFRLMQPSRVRAVPGFRAEGEAFNDFVLLPFGAAAPPPTTRPSVAVPASEGNGPLGSDAFMPASEAARKFETPVPVLDPATLPTSARGLVASRTYVRANAQGQLVWCSTDYRRAGSPNGPTVLTMRLDRGVGRPIPVAPSGSPSSGLIPPVKVGYLPKPGVVLSLGPGSTALWTEGDALFVVEFDASLLPGVSLEQLAHSFTALAG